jgi:hypothetical protein
VRFYCVSHFEYQLPPQHVCDYQPLLRNEHFNVWRHCIFRLTPSCGKHLSLVIPFEEAQNCAYKRTGKIFFEHSSV